MNHYKVAQIGCGNRGRIHLSGWVANQDRCELAGVCDMDSAKMEAALGNLGIKPGCFTDAE